MVGRRHRDVKIHGRAIFDNAIEPGLEAGTIREDGGEAARHIRLDILRFAHPVQPVENLESLKAQNKVEAAAWVQREFDKAWEGADIKLNLRGM